MVHFSSKDWKGFAQGKVEEKKSRAMEEHLLVCGQCIEKYLSFFTRDSAASAAKGLSPQFTSNVMKMIGETEGQRRGNGYKQSSIFYYATAACLTILFMTAGVFEGFAGIIPEITRAKVQMESSFITESKSIVQFGWSDKLLNSTLTFVESIKPKGEEVPD